MVRNINKEYDFISKGEFEKADKNYLRYLLIFAFKGQRPFHINFKEVSDVWNNLSEDKDKLKETFQKLLKLDGVGFSTASAILHFKFPNKYAIIDRNVLSGILKEEKIELGKIRDGASEKILDKNLELYKQYIDFLHNKIKEGKFKSIFKSIREAEFYYFEKGQKMKNKKNKLLMH